MWQVGEIPNYENLLKNISAQLELQNALLIGIASLLHSDQAVTFSQNRLSASVQNLDNHQSWHQMWSAIEEYNKYVEGVKEQAEEKFKEAEKEFKKPGEEDEAPEEPEPDKENGA